MTNVCCFVSYKDMCIIPDMEINADMIIQFKWRKLLQVVFSFSFCHVLSCLFDFNNRSHTEFDCACLLAYINNKIYINKCKINITKATENFPGIIPEFFQNLNFYFFFSAFLKRNFWKLLWIFEIITNQDSKKSLN